jgi:hypothetical protein
VIWVNVRSRDTVMAFAGLASIMGGNGFSASGEKLPGIIMAVPVIGVVTSAAALGEALGTGQIAALTFTLAGVALAAR